MMVLKGARQVHAVILNEQNTCVVENLHSQGAHNYAKIILTNARQVFAWL